jgi:hypothetical protein
MANNASLKMAGFDVTPNGRFCPTDDSSAEVRVSGGLNPFALTLPQDQYLSIIAVQGLEPRNQ